MSREPINDMSDAVPDWDYDATYRVKLSHVDVDLGELLPSYELAWCAIDCLSGKLERPFVVALASQKVTLRV